MKVLWFASTPCGATEYLTGSKVTGGGWLYALSQALKQYNEVELHIAFYWASDMPGFKYDGIYYHPILRSGSGSKLGRYINRLRKQFYSSSDKNEIELCMEVYNNVNPDLVHFHGSEENYGFAASHMDSSKCLLSIQGMLAPYYYKLYSGVQRDSVLKSESWIQKLLLDGQSAKDRSMKLRAKGEITRLKSIPHILGRTSWDRDCSIAINPSRQYFVCDEILRPEFMKSEWQPHAIGDKVIITTTISFGLYKGLEMVYEAARLLTDAKINFEWNVVGISNRDSYDVLIQKITHINPENVHVNLLGRKNASQMIEYFNQSNIFVQVSHIENSPNSLCEAMVLGIPIIASYAGGSSSMLEDGKEGVLIQDGDPYRLAGAIINMSNHYEDAIAMGRLARQRAINRHQPDRVCKQLMDVYNEILNR